MTLRDLKDAVCGLALHDLTPVNVESVAVEGGSVVFRFEESALAVELEEAKADLESARQDYSEENTRAEVLANELREANKLLDAVKDQGRGRTLREYRDIAEQAQLRAAGWKKYYDEMDRELTTLRKRKGMLAALYANQSAVMDILRDAQSSRPIDAAKARELCQKINHDSRT